MYTVKYEMHRNDYDKQHMEKTFNSLNDIENWIFNQMKNNYHNDEFNMYFPIDGIFRIKFKPQTPGPQYWIHEIDSSNGIEFTDGEYTCSQEHKSETIQHWLEHCEERRKNPIFKFA